jgi:hypothetical protein
VTHARTVLLEAAREKSGELRARAATELIVDRTDGFSDRLIELKNRSAIAILPETGTRSPGVRDVVDACLDGVPSVPKV